MPIVAANGIDIAYDEVGDAKAPVIVLIMGLGTQMIAWPEAFCVALAQRGFRVVRFDNRDIGLSTKFETAAPIDLAAAFARAMAGKSVEAPYTLDDMVADAIGLMDALGIGNAHVVGASMGGMIAQIVAARYANRTRSLTSIMSSSGDPGLPPGKPEAISALLAPRLHPDDRENVIKAGMTILRVIGSPGFPTSEADLRAKVEQAADRSYYPPGAAGAAGYSCAARCGALPGCRAARTAALGADDRSTIAIRGFLESLGYQVHGWGRGRNVRAPDADLSAVAAQIEKLQEDSGLKVSLVGWSRGGIIAREVARQIPAAVRLVITLGSPFARPARVLGLQ